MELVIRVWDKITEQMIYPFTGNGDDLFLSLEGQICSEDEEIQDDGSHLLYRGYRMTPLLYTGIKDKIDNMIFDGDILSPCTWEDNKPVGEPFKVYYNEEKLTWYIYKISGDLIMDKPLSEAVREGKLPYDIVIGNIYQNEDLMQAETK